MMKYLCMFLGLLLLGMLPLQAQTKKKNKQHKRAGTSTTTYGARMEEVPSGPKEYLHIYLENSRGVLLGNKCMEDYTNQLGFRYVLMPPGQQGSLDPVEVRLNNFGVKLMLLLKNGPFWHHRLNKKTRHCRERSGDFIG